MAMKKRAPIIEVRDVSISFKRYGDDSMIIATGGLVFADSMGSMSLASKKISKKTAQKIVDLVGEIYDMNLKAF
jgi:hypothetical protein